MSFLRDIFPARYAANDLARQQLLDAQRQQEQEQVQLLGNPYRARLLLGDMQMQNQPTPNFMQVPGGSPMPSAAPRPGLGSIGQDRNLMAMGADPLAVVQNRMSANAALDAPMKLGDKEIVTNLRGQVLASNRGPEQPPEDPTSVREYEAAKAQGFPGSYLDFRTALARAGSSNVSVNTGDRKGAELEKNFAPLLKESYDGAAAARDTIVNTQQIKEIVDKGIITGAAANFRLDFARALATAGITDGEDVANTETFVTQMGRNVLQLVKGLGAGSGISNADLKFAERVAAGDITLNKDTIKRVLDIQERAARSNIKTYNTRFKDFFESADYPDALKNPYRVDLPQDQAPGDAVASPALQNGGWSIRKVGG